MVRPHPITSLLALSCLVGYTAAVEPAETVEEDLWELMVERTVPLRTHSIAPPYVDSDLQNRWWDFGADAVINTNKHIRLTQDRPSQQGFLWSRVPMSSINWQVEFEFKVDGKAHNLFGDGFAMWVTQERAKPGPVFGSADNFNGLGIFFDTYANKKHGYSFPRVTAMIGDGKTPYDHGGDNEAGEIAACSENFRRRGIVTKGRLTYMRDKMLQLKLQTREEGQWKTCFQIKANLPTSPYLGFSALTGDVSDNHDIVSIQASTATLKKEYRDHGNAPHNYKPDQKVLGVDKENLKPKRAKSSGGMASVFMLILKIIGVGAFLAFALAAYRTYDAQKQKSRRAW
ncbi:lectin [Kockovaella imperatae]|uniref:Lectin n=1 Tax=Kockovaella imperatae TaxID=4999 RepID=A0A1Y1URP8_9TREE|nr:lectin [Kockovaella imperatae]ORX40728.1 lectin [Kockovaella imperatae]